MKTTLVYGGIIIVFIVVLAALGVELSLRHLIAFIIGVVAGVLYNEFIDG